MKTKTKKKKNLHWYSNICVVNIEEVPASLYTNRTSTHYPYFCHKKLNRYIILTDHFFLLAVTGYFLSTFAVSKPLVQGGTLSTCVMHTQSYWYQNLPKIKVDMLLCISGEHAMLSVLL